MPSLWRRITVAGLPLLAVQARAQCADGSPPPCRTVASATSARRANPPLDDNTWIVVPFDNLARSADADWLRGASVNLLYLDMSRWQDIHVVDDERVADLIREVPEASNAQSFTLNAGLAVAKRAGAGKLVMGDVLRVGSRTAVTAKVFDVRTGQRVRSVREEAPVHDSVMAIFPRLAQKVLNLSAPSGANLGSLGTSRVDAYQEYLAGVSALNQFDLATARRHLERAIALDSAFALAHFKMSVVVGWEDPNDPRRKSFAEAAARSSTGLPRRERTLITGQLQQTSGDWTRACQTYGELARADSSDAEAWYGLGECLFHDLTIEAVGGDTSRLRFRADLGASIDAFEHALQLDPSYHLAYQHIIDALTSERHAIACYRRDAADPCANYTAFLVRSGDSLIAKPVLVTDTAGIRLQADQYAQTRSRRRNLQAANATASSWLASAPNEPRANTALIHVLVREGRIDEANALLPRARTTSRNDLMRLLLERMEIAYKRWQPAEAIRLYDSVRAGTMPLAGAGAPHFGNAIAGYGGTAFGRIVEFDSIINTNLIRNALPAGRAYAPFAIRATLTGLAADTLAVLERAVFDANVTRGNLPPTIAINLTLGFALRMPRPSWPPLDPTVGDLRVKPALALAAGDTTRLRAAARSLDSAIARLAVSVGEDSGFSVIAAEAYLQLRDSASALRAVRFALDSVLTTAPLFPLNSGSFANMVAYLPRLMLLRADLALASGARDEARIWYRRFADVWATAVPEFQPLVQRARAALASLPG